jgi:hypothetical protein
MLARMCGRVRLSSDVSEIRLVFSIPPHQPTPAECQRLSAFTRISILIIAADSRTIHSEYLTTEEVCRVVTTEAVTGAAGIVGGSHAADPAKVLGEPWKAVKLSHRKPTK